MSKTTLHKNSDEAFLAVLRSRLFDLSKRNRNIYFNPGSSFAPIFPEGISSEMPFKEGDVLEFFEDQTPPEIFNKLNTLRLKADRNKRELGFHQLKLATSFIHWTNTKTTPYDEICSPLILFDVDISRTRGIRDSFILKLSSGPQLNPFLTRFWHELFDYNADPVLTEGQNPEEEVVRFLQTSDPILQVELQSPQHKKHTDEWIIDINNPVIGHFDFRKMSLLKDFDKIMEDETLHTIVRPFNALKHESKQLSDREFYGVLPYDPSQKEAIEKILSGENMVLQGPPGTGKSQTITNTIANLAGTGKRVLVLSDKKVALDVIQHRLQQTGLGDLSLALHDSKNDRKTFISNLKKTYRKFIDKKSDPEAVLYERKKALLNIEKEKTVIKRYFDELAEEDENGISLNLLFEEAINNKQPVPELNRESKLKLPAYVLYRDVAAQLTELSDLLEKLGYERTFANHPLSALHSNMLSSEDAIKELSTSVGLIKQSGHLSMSLSYPELKAKKLSELYLLFVQASVYRKLADYKLLWLLDETNKQTKSYFKLDKKRQKLQTDIEHLNQEIALWKIKPSSDDLNRAIEILESSSKLQQFFSFKYRRLVSKMKSHYDFSAHMVKPEMIDVLKHLQNHYHLVEELRHTKTAIQNLLETDDIELIQVVIKEAVKKTHHARYIDLLLNNDGAVLDTVLKLENDFNVLYYESKKVLENAADLTIDEVKDKIQSISGCLSELNTISHYTKKIHTQKQVLTAFKNLKLNDFEFKAAVLQNEIEKRLSLRYWLKDTDAFDIKKRLIALSKAELDMFKKNAQYINSRVETRFTYILKLTETSASKLNPEEKEKKKFWLNARRILEREFGKSKRFKSLRELEELECGDLLRAMKPVWMMSPHSVAENLSLLKHFDAVIFDEASQVRLEEGLSAFLRAEQYVIAGDEMQLPPAGFFSKRNENDEDFPESLLSYFSNLAGKSTLKWHYRSESAELIKLSNQHFYDNKLIPVPSPQANDTPIELIYLEDGAFINRKNEKEAQLIVKQLKKLLLDGIRSIGIAAFSIEQQQEIEKRINHEMQEDPVFSGLVEEALAYESEGHFEGLFVKNLERIQGDERDYILISTAYGPNENGKFIQQFGPLSQEGGEKRLNVLFTRARKQIILLTSIVPSDISSDKTGPVFLKHYLNYAASGSADNLKNHPKQKTYRIFQDVLDLELDITPLNSETKTAIIHDKKQQLLLIDLHQNPEISAYFPVFYRKGWDIRCVDFKTLYYKAELLRLQFSSL